jgi:4-hydroxy-tetrahydrodipicolinate reductase
MARIGIIGSAGRMGQALQAAVVAAGHDLAGGIDRDGDAAALAQASDVLVDFSAPAALEFNLDAAIHAGKPIVVGTTGLEERHHWLIDAAAVSIPVLQTGNTSLGVTLLAHLVQEAAARLGEDWDIEIVETHHRMKVDAPSGTALLLGEAAARGRQVGLKDVAVRGRDGITGQREAGTIGCRAARRQRGGRSHRAFPGRQRAPEPVAHGGKPGHLCQGGDPRGRLAARPRTRSLHHAASARAGRGTALKKDQIFEFFRRLAEANPAPETELAYGNTYQLLVAVTISAQATDVGVNKATRRLFEEVKTPAQMVALGEEGLKAHIKSIGLFNTKAKNVIALSEILVRDHGGEVPADRDALTALPGVGARPRTWCSTPRSAWRPLRWTRISFAWATAPAWPRARRPRRWKPGSTRKCPGRSAWARTTG